MKNKIYWIIAAVSAAVCGGFMRMLPDRVPVHFGADGTPDRISSKYELFIFTGALILTAVPGEVIEHMNNKKLKDPSDEKKREEIRVNSKVTKTAVVCSQLTLMVIQLYMLFSLRESADVMKFESDGFMVVSNLMISILVIVMGNLMPKAKRNESFGVRTSWSMANDKTWLESNRMAGKLMFGGGLVCAASSLIFGGIGGTVIILTVIVGVAIASCVYSKKVYDMYGREE